MPDKRFYTTRGSITPLQIQDLVPCEITGDDTRLLSDVATLKGATGTDISFFHNKKYLDDLKSTRAGAVFCSREFAEHVPTGTVALITDLPYRAFAITANHLYPTVEMDLFQTTSKPFVAPGVSIHPTAVVMDGADIGEGTTIGPHVIIGPGVLIGQNCRIGAHVSISHALIGNDVTLFPGARIGQAGFGFAMDEKGHITVPQLGRVILEDNVEIGANTTIDRGTLEDTFIGQGTRIDNLVQIGHGVKMGKNCVIVAQVGISGSTTMGNYVIAAGQAGLTGHLNIGDGARIAAQAGVVRDVERGEAIAGCPAIPVKQWHRQTVALSKLIQPKSREN